MNELAHALRRAVRGEVRFDAAMRAAYASDSSNYRQVPVGVVLPRDTADVAEALRVCRERDVPVLPRGAGTSLAGQACNVAVVLDFSRYMNRIVSLDPEAATAVVEPGVVLDRLQEATRPHGLAFGPDPATHAVCTVGGMIGNDSCGVHSIVAGRTSASVEELELLTYRGAHLRAGDPPTGLRHELLDLRDRSADAVRAGFPPIPRRVSGYGLDMLLPENGFAVPRALVGSEGTCAVVVAASVRLMRLPPARALVVVGYDDVCAAADDAPSFLARGPIGLEGIDAAVLRRDPALPEGSAWLLVEFGGDTQEEATSRARAAARGHDAVVVEAADDQRALWAIREAAVGIGARAPDGTDRFGGWEDAAVPPERLGEYLREFTRLLARSGRTAALYGHFGDGCIHTRIDFDLATTAGVAAYRRFVEEAAELVVAYGGSLSGEHGDGRARSELLPRMFGPELIDAFRAFKTIWDPDGKLNPGVIVDPAPLDSQLRLGGDFVPARPRTHFAFAHDSGSFGRAAMRCVGVGRCRKTDAGAMCPSFMATRDELHSPRGRARLLFELQRGDPIGGGWRDPNVRAALDLCLACKSCKSECPAGVDIASYKAEFLSHYYAGRLRPPSMYAVGLIDLWSRVAERSPSVANAAARALKPLLGIAPDRRLPSFAPETFRASFARRPRRPRGRRPRIVLWPDTFTDAFAPERGRAAVEVLEAAGFHVDVPAAAICCGRPLYDCGMLSLAARRLRHAIEQLRDELRAGTTIVGLEPSCVAVLRDELPALLPDDADGRLLTSQTRTLAEVLAESGWEPPPLDGVALLHGHCHQKALWSTDAEAAVLTGLGLEVEVLDSGCCGMAGGFGLQREHYDVSVACGERVLLPAVRAVARDGFVVADGFSCREQIEQLTGRRALHTAEVLARALERQTMTARPAGYAQGGADRWPFSM